MQLQIIGVGEMNAGGSNRAKSLGKLDANTHPVHIYERTLFKVKTDPILYVGKLEDKLTEFVHANGDYLFIVFVFLCSLAVVWLLSRPRKLSLSEPSSARTRAII